MTKTWNGVRATLFIRKKCLSKCYQKIRNDEHEKQNYSDIPIYYITYPQGKYNRNHAE